MLRAPPLPRGLALLQRAQLPLPLRLAPPQRLALLGELTRLVGLGRG